MIAQGYKCTASRGAPPICTMYRGVLLATRDSRARSNGWKHTRTQKHISRTCAREQAPSCRRRRRVAPEAAEGVVIDAPLARCRLLLLHAFDDLLLHDPPAPRVPLLLAQVIAILAAIQRTTCVLNAIAVCVHGKCIGTSNCEYESTTTVWASGRQRCRCAPARARDRGAALSSRGTASSYRETV